MQFIHVAHYYGAALLHNAKLIPDPRLEYINEAKDLYKTCLSYFKNDGWMLFPLSIFKKILISFLKPHVRFLSVMLLYLPSLMLLGK